MTKVLIANPQESASSQLFTFCSVSQITLSRITLHCITHNIVFIFHLNLTVHCILSLIHGVTFYSFLTQSRESLARMIFVFCVAGSCRRQLLTMTDPVPGPTLPACTCCWSTMIEMKTSGKVSKIKRIISPFLTIDHHLSIFLPNWVAFSWKCQNAF